MIWHQQITADANLHSAVFGPHRQASSHDCRISTFRCRIPPHDCRFSTFRCRISYIFRTKSDSQPSRTDRLASKSDTETSKSDSHELKSDRVQRHTNSTPTACRHHTQIRPTFPYSARKTIAADPQVSRETPICSGRPALTSISPAG